MLRSLNLYKERKMDETNGVVLRKVRADGLVMGRVPKPTRDFFIKLANSEFASDYGLTLKFLVDEAIRRNILESMDIKINYAIELLEKAANFEKKPEKKQIKLLSGRKIEKEVE